MDELFEDIGELRAGQAAINQRMDEASADRRQLRAETSLGFADLRREIIANHAVTVEREATFMGRLDSLYATRNWMRGVGAVGAGVLLIWGHDMLEGVWSLITWRPK